MTKIVGILIILFNGLRISPVATQVPSPGNTHKKKRLPFDQDNLFSFIVYYRSDYLLEAVAFSITFFLPFVSIANLTAS